MRYSRPATTNRSPGPNRRPRRRSTIPFTATRPPRISSYACPPVGTTPAHFNASPRVIPAVVIAMSTGDDRRWLSVDPYRGEHVQIVNMVHRAQHARTERSGEFEEHLGRVHIRQGV